MNKAEGDSHELGRTLELEGNWKENSNKSLKSLRLCEHLKKRSTSAKTSNIFLITENEDIKQNDSDFLDRKSLSVRAFSSNTHSWRSSLPGGPGDYTQLGEGPNGMANGIKGEC